MRVRSAGEWREDSCNGETRLGNVNAEIDGSIGDNERSEVAVNRKLGESRQCSAEGRINRL